MSGRSPSAHAAPAAAPHLLRRPRRPPCTSSPPRRQAQRRVRRLEIFKIGPRNHGRGHLAGTCRTRTKSRPPPPAPRPGCGLSPPPSPPLSAARGARTSNQVLVRRLWGNVYSGPQPLPPHPLSPADRLSGGRRRLGAARGLSGLGAGDPRTNPHGSSEVGGGRARSAGMLAVTSQSPAWKESPRSRTGKGGRRGRGGGPAAPGRMRCGGRQPPGTEGRPSGRAGAAASSPTPAPPRGPGTRTPAPHGHPRAEGLQSVHSAPAQAEGRSPSDGGPRGPSIAPALRAAPARSSGCRPRRPASPQGRNTGRAQDPKSECGRRPSPVASGSNSGSGSGSAPCPPRAPGRPASPPPQPSGSPGRSSWVRLASPQPNNATPHRPSPRRTAKQRALRLAVRVLAALVRRGPVGKGRGFR